MKIILFRSIAIGLAGSVGAILRYVVGLMFGRLNLIFPFGTLFINLSGSFFLGWFLTHISSRNVSDTTRLAVAVGFVGAYTTFSTYMYDSNQLAEKGAFVASTANLIGSLVLGIIAVRLGVLLARRG
jgi:CrcB protein